MPAFRPAMHRRPAALDPRLMAVHRDDRLKSEAHAVSGPSTDGPPRAGQAPETEAPESLAVFDACPLGLGRSASFPWPQWRDQDPHRTVFFDEGQGQTLVFVHGLGGNATHWEPVVDALAPGRRLVGLDLLGSGWSAKPEVPYSLEMLRDHLIAFVERRGIFGAVLVGHSLGAAVVTLAALARPDLARALVWVSPVGVLPLPSLMRLAAPKLLHQSLIFPFLRYMPRTVLGRTFSEGPRRNPHVRWFLDCTARDASGGSHVRDLARFTEAIAPSLARSDLTEEIPRLHLPILALAGEKDSLTAPFIRRLGLREGLRTALIPNSGHVPFVEQPEAFLRSLLAFLDDPRVKEVPLVCSGP